MMNTVNSPVESTHILLTTATYQIHSAGVNNGDGELDTVYALEGSMQWLRENLGTIEDASGVEMLAVQMNSNNVFYFYPVLAGFSAPYWSLVRKIVSVM